MSIYTEAEANTKWCPLARLAEPWCHGSGTLSPTTAVAAVNRGSPELLSEEWEPNALCIASKCMAWRWAEPDSDNSEDFPDDPVRGYCGAFGRVRRGA